MMKPYSNFLFLILLMTISCTTTDQDVEDFNILGLKPIYGDDTQLKIITVGDTVNMLTPGKIVYKAPYLFVNEIDKGVHVINNSNPNDPIKESFISIPFNKDIAIKGNVIYADNNNDLVSLIYHSKDSIQLIDREPNTFDKIPVFPVDYTGYFECIDESKGPVIRWETVTLTNPKCKIF